MPGEVNPSFTPDHVVDSSSGESHSSTDECKVNILLNSSDTVAHHKRKPSHWYKLKRRFSHDESTNFNKHPHYEAQVLPDDLEYIEGGDIAVVHSDHHYMESRTPSATSNADLNAVREANEPETAEKDQNSNAAQLTKVLTVEDITENDVSTNTERDSEPAKDNVQKSKIYVTKGGKAEKPLANKTSPVPVRKVNGVVGKKDQSPDKKAPKTRL